MPKFASSILDDVWVCTLHRPFQTSNTIFFEPIINQKDGFALTESETSLNTLNYSNFRQNPRRALILSLRYDRLGNSCLTQADLQEVYRLTGLGQDVESVDQEDRKNTHEGFGQYIQVKKMDATITIAFLWGSFTL